MTRFKWTVSAFLDAGLRMWSLVCLTGLRYGPVLMALPLCSSICFFAFRFTLSAFGVLA
ncbi:hypothetical protein [Burkholderia sp. Leaf177]|uniref:hypothetical protein n=1 Tax=Burkholderia sp. Leaf177 TaxID=1736287 RepID=UPI000A6B54EF|nr:hypothetical protein [Burkholderia sp. Leaf177]